MKYIKNKNTDRLNVKPTFMDKFSSKNADNKKTKEKV